MPPHRSLNRCFDRTGLHVAQHHPISARMRMLPLACLVFAATTPALGEVYKWADENGVTHYSSAPPEKPKAKFRRIDSKALMVSQANNPEPDATRLPQQQAAKDLISKVDALERQVDAERQARQAADAQNLATQAFYAQRLAEQQSSRNIALVPTIPTVSGVFFAPPFHRFHTHPCRSMTAGAMMNFPSPTAGHDRRSLDFWKPSSGWVAQH